MFHHDVKHTGRVPRFDPVPDIKANGEDDDFTLPLGDTLTLTVSLDPGSFEGVSHDWWIWAYYVNYGYRWWWVWPGNWIQGSAQPALTWPLIQVNNYQVGQAQLPFGVWVFNFVVDEANGDLEYTYLDDIKVTIN